MTPAFIRAQKDGVTIAVSVQPGAKKSEWVGVLEDGTVKIKIKAPAQEGKANQELIRFLSESLGLRKSGVRIVSGETGRKKKILLSDIDPASLLSRLPAEIRAAAV
jgi:uncharacterized protein